MKPIHFQLLLGLAIISLTAPVQAQLGRDRPDFFEQGQRQMENEIRRLETQQTEPILTTAPFPSIQWQNLVFREIGFMIQMPKGEITEDLDTFSAGGESINFHVFANTSESGKFIVGYSEPITTQNQDTDSLLTNFQDDLIEMTGVELTEVQSIMMGAYRGRELFLKDDQETIKMRIYWIKNRIHVVGVRQPTINSSDPIIQNFFQSFQLL